MSSEINYTQIKEKLLDDASKITNEDVLALANKAGNIEPMFGPGPLEKVLRVMLSLVQDYTSGAYTDVQWAVIAGIAAVFTKVFDPLESASDLIPLRGQLKDMAVVSVYFLIFEKDLERYVAWRNNRDGR